MFDIVDTTFNDEREFIMCRLLQAFSIGKKISLQLICNAHSAPHTVFLLCGAEGTLRSRKIR